MANQNSLNFMISESYQNEHISAIPYLRLAGRQRSRFNALMEIQDIRRANLQAIIESRFGGTAGLLADAIGRPRPNVYQILNGIRPVGGKAARAFEVRLGLPSGALDKLPDGSLDAYFISPNGDLVAVIVKDLQKMNERNLRVLRVMMDGLLAGQRDDDSGDPLAKDDGRKEQQTRQS